MKTFLMTALIATTGCSAAGNPQESATTRPSSASGASRLQEVTPAAISAKSSAGKVLRTRTVTPSHTPSSGGALDGTSGSNVAPATWHTLDNPAPITAGIALLLTDGSVMIQDVGGPDFWRLTPDARGSYLKGRWSQLALLPDGYSPLYFASAVLPDGRVIVMGGEYENFKATWTSRGAIYDPTKDTWTPVAPPAGWTTIGDAVSTVLADGRYLLSNCCTTEAAILDPKTLTWTPFGTNKADINAEEGWTLLQTGQVLTVDTNDFTDLLSTERLNPWTGKWSKAGDTPSLLADNNAQGTGSWEMGPQVLRPDGTVFAAGATGHTAIYHPSGRWTAGPDFPSIAGQGQLDVADGPGALLPNGHVLVVASPGVYNAPAHVFDFDGKALIEVGAPPQAVNDSSYNASLLVLPTGEILFTDSSNDVEIYTSSGRAGCGEAPRIDESCGLENLQPGQTYEVSGTQLHGLSQAVAYGDDGQAATNYPLVRITNRATGDVVYARTHDFSNMSIAPGASSRFAFDVPPSLASGDSDLTVVANGIASEPIRVNVGVSQN